ncbi:MAG: DNA-binding domain-containing protein, partial [Phycisphaerales bacterium]
QTKWHFSTRFDPRLAALANQTTGPLEHSTTSPDPLALFKAAPRAKQQAALAKAEAVRLYRAWRTQTHAITDAQEQARLLGLIRARTGLEVGCTMSLRRWSEAVGGVDAKRDAHLAAAALLDRRGGSREVSTTTFDEPAWDFFAALYLQDNQLSVKRCWSLTGTKSGEEGWNWISLSRAKQLVHERLSASVRTLAREGAKAWRHKHLPPVEQDENAWAAGQCWETDHSRCDFFVRTVRGGQVVAVRPWLTVFLDRRSRKLMGWSMNFDANADTIRAALHSALSDEACSVPEAIVLDNGKDFASHEFCGLTKQQRRARTNDETDPCGGGWPGLFGLLGIAAHFATPYNHNGKARVERFFGVVHRGFDRVDMAASWCGSDAEPRDPDAVKAILAEPIKLPTLDEARRWFASYAAAYNADADRNIDALVDASGARLSPSRWYTDHLPVFRALPRKAELLTMLEHKWARPLTPSKSGVSLKLDGRTFSFGQHEPALADLVGSGARVHVTFNPSDMSAVRVYDDRFALLCVAPLNPRHGGLLDSDLKREDLKEAIRRKRQHERDVKRQVDTAAAVLPAAELAALVRRDREQAETKANLEAAGVDTQSAPPMRLVRTALTESSASADERNRSRVPLRKAAGAEHDEMPFGFQPRFTPSSTGVDAAGEDIADLGSFSLAGAIGPARSQPAPDRPEPSHELAPMGDDFDLLRELSA